MFWVVLDGFFSFNENSFSSSLVVVFWGRKVGDFIGVFFFGECVNLNEKLFFWDEFLVWVCFLVGFFFFEVKVCFSLGD